VIGRKPTVTRYRSTYSPDHPLAQADGRVPTHRLVLYDKIGTGVHACHWCGRAVRWIGGGRGDQLVADHVDGDRWNNDPANLVPSCHRCNSHRGRGFRWLTHCPAGHELTPVNTYVWVRKRKTVRACKICSKASAVERTRKRRQKTRTVTT
jgi:hypothetical protein